MAEVTQVLPEVLELTDMLTIIASASTTAGFLIATIPWLVGMVFTAFKKIISS